MKNMKQKIDEKVRGTAKKVVINAGEKAIEGSICRGFLYEPEIPRKLLESAKKG